MATRFDVAQRLFQPQRAAASALRSAQRAGGIQGGQTGSLGMSYGTAAGDSEGGWVKVAMDTSGMVDPEDAPTVSCVCDTPIKDGQRVAVLTTSSGQLKAIPIGDNIADMSIRGVDVQYALSSSSTKAPSSGWTSTPPSTIPDGQYLWQRTATTSGTGVVSHSAAVCITSGDGKDGRGVEDIQEQYYLSTSSTLQTGGSWQTTCPEWVDGRYIWTRSRIDWTDGTTTYTTPVLASAINQANENAAKATQYCWNDYEGTHVSTSPNSTSGSNVLLDSEGLAIRDGKTEIAYYSGETATLARGAFGIRGSGYESMVDLPSADIGGSDLRIGTELPSDYYYDRYSVYVSDLLPHRFAAMTTGNRSKMYLGSNDAALSMSYEIEYGSYGEDSPFYLLGFTYGIKVNVKSNETVYVEVSAKAMAQGLSSGGQNFALGIFAGTSTNFSNAEGVTSGITTGIGYTTMSLSPVVVKCSSTTYFFLAARSTGGGGEIPQYSSTSSTGATLTVRVIGVVKS